MNLYYRTKVFTEGYGLRAKMKLIPNTVFRAFVFTVGGSSHRFSYVADKYLPEVLIKNKNGIFKCRKGSSDIWLTFEGWERGLTNYLTKMQSGVFVDIGANVGKYTIRMAKQIGNRGSVIAIEADPENYEALTENIRINKLENVHAFNVACWNKEEDLRFNMCPMGKKGDSSIKSEVSGRAVTVHGTTLDNILKGLGIKEVDVVKIDVEGAEKEVLLGMKETVSSSNTIEVLFEAWNEDYLLECKKILKDYGLSVGDKGIDGNMYRARKAA
jgi:FkbM family methyltransferase